MTTAMARLPCKQSSPSQQPRFNDNFCNTRNYWDMQQRQVAMPAPPFIRSHRHSDYAGKRKSAVELLQESKAFYVKSETVLDRKQELKNSGHLQVSQVTAPPRLLRKCTSNSCAQQQQSCCWATCHDQDKIDGMLLSPQRTLPAPALPPKSPRLVPVPQRRAISGPPSATASDQLQTKLRRLLNTDSKENMFLPDADYAGAQLSNCPPREDKFRYSPERLSAYPDDQQHHSNTLDTRFRFGRSNSHSHTSRSVPRTASSVTGEMTVCHKSLPDLHTSTRRRSSLSPRTSTKSAKPLISSHHQSATNCPDCETSSDYSDHSFKRDSISYRRHIRRSFGSGGGDASSVLSSGGRTQKSSGSSKLSHGATARDSGGSSGHCTHRSEPPPRNQDYWSHVRRDSGASTQHSTERDRSRKSSYNNSGTPSIVRHYSPDSESSNGQEDYSPTCNSRISDGWKESHGRPILRSKSDISDRYWRHESRSSKSNRPARSVTQLEIFFDHLGLDTDNFQRITEPESKCSSPVFFDSVSSVDSALGLYSWVGNNQANQSSQWHNNNCSVGMGNDDCSQRTSDPPSIVERNARIIKWLCQCRKVQFGYS